MVLIYVDDILITNNDDNVVQAFANHLNDLFFLKDLMSYFLGIEFHTSKIDVHLSQHKYMHDLLSMTCLLDSKPTSSLMVSRKGLSKLNGVFLDDPTQYHTVIGALQYLTIIRP